MSEIRNAAPTDEEIARWTRERQTYLDGRSGLITAIFAACPRMDSRRVEALADFVLATEDERAPAPTAAAELPVFEEVLLDVDRLNVTMRVAADRWEHLGTEAEAFIRADLEARLARLPDQGHLELPHGWQEGLREKVYDWLLRGRAWRCNLGRRLRGRWPVRYRRWDALLYVPYALDNLPLPQDQMRFKVVMPVWRKRA